MLLKHNNLTIRNATPADAQQLAAWWNDGKVMAHAGFPNGTGERAEEIAERIARDTDENRRLILELDGRPIGEMTYGSVDAPLKNLDYGRKEERAVGIGIKICDFSLHDQGLGKQYLSMLIRALLGDFGYKKVVLDTNLDNLRAQHVYERLGFRRARVNVDAWTDQLGRPQSAVVYELFPEDFKDFAK